MCIYVNGRVYYLVDVTLGGVDMLDEDITEDFEGAVVKYLFLAIASNPE